MQGSNLRLPPCQGTAMPSDDVTGQGLTATRTPVRTSEAENRRDYGSPNQPFTIPERRHEGKHEGTVPNPLRRNQSLAPRRSCVTRTGP